MTITPREAEVLSIAVFMTGSAAGIIVPLLASANRVGYRGLYLAGMFAAFILASVLGAVIPQLLVAGPVMGICYALTVGCLLAACIYRAPQAAR